jgi:hypothetical protein
VTRPFPISTLTLTCRGFFNRSDYLHFSSGNDNSLGSDRLGSFQRLALPPTGYPSMGILNLDCCHSRSYDSQSIVVVSAQSCSNSGPRIRTHVVSWNASTVQVKVTESTLGSDIAVVCSSFEPYHCLALIMWYSDSFDIA